MCRLYKNTTMHLPLNVAFAVRGPHLAAMPLARPPRLTGRPPKVERTRGRPLASGAVSVPQAVAFLGAQLLLGLGILLQLNPYTQLLGVASLGLVATYPLVGPHTRLEHVVSLVLELIACGGQGPWRPHAALGRAPAANAAAASCTPPPLLGCRPSPRSLP